MRPLVSVPHNKRVERTASGLRRAAAAHAPFRYADQEGKY